MAAMNLPILDLTLQYQALKQEIECEVLAVLASGEYVLGPNVRSLEREVAEYCGVKHAVSCASGTDALHLALRAVGAGPGDEVITSTFSFAATAEAICHSGARPVFVDIDPATYNINPARVEASVTPGTRAVIPVHLYGQPADLAPIADTCRRHGLALIEDCAQSFGAEYGGRKSGAYGDIGCFSFYPSKNLGACGDGGMVVTDDDALAQSVRVFREHGRGALSGHAVVGYNSRLDEIQAAILRVKLRRVDEFNRLRRHNARLYTERFQNSRVVPPIEDGKGLHVFHQYTIRSARRDAVRDALAQAGVGSAIYYPVPLHRERAFAAGGVSLPHAEAAASQVLSLPMYPELTAGQIDEVCRVVLAA
jgi:UDP-N-acetyl-3-dehydro-alpha-D-glucosamine 3-aminotranferase